ncbi:S41 family peptidase [Acidobacteria bacterium AB60]|nr:S41 family peptidase [Acidobacteria bacterium AB60]
MSEKIYGWLLGLYPSAFRHRYGEEVLEDFRECMGRQTTNIGKIRAGVALFADLAAGLPQAWRNRYALPAAATASSQISGVPVFGTLEEEPLRPGSIAMGAVSATCALALFAFVMGHVERRAFVSGNQRMRAAAAGSQTNPGSDAATAEADERLRSAALLKQCSIDKLEEHPEEIGYLQLSWFADPASCTAVVDAAMRRLGETNAVIVDLRETRGGYPEMVRRVAGWFFGRSVTWYNPRAASVAQLATNPEPGSGLVHKPLFVLISSHTFSGAEHFAYNMQALKRATLVGETTSGASHAGAGNLPAAALKEPKALWEGHGVAPDVRVPAAEALGRAETMAAEAIRAGEGQGMPGR